MVGESAQRHLAAILAVDVVGYSRLMEADEIGTFERLRAHRKELFEPEIQNHHGRVFKLMGDGLLAEFTSVIDAVNCATVLQREMAKRNDGISVEERIDMRMGLHVGEVIVDGEDRQGDAVNIAARLQQVADPGGILVSRPIVDQVSRRMTVTFESLGEERLKNIAEPIAIYRIKTGDPINSTRRVRPAKPKPLQRRSLLVSAIALLVTLTGIFVRYQQVRLSGDDSTSQSAMAASIAVLPFDNLSGDPSLDYFSDGVTEDIITMLAREPDLSVRARNTSFAYKGTATDVQQVGRDLDVHYVLEGSVQKFADKVRITSQLIDAKTGAHVWADRYDGEGRDPLALQDEITAKIISTLAGVKGQIRNAEYAAAWGKDTADLTEYDYFQRGHEYFMRFTPKDNDRAIEIWQEGLRLFPNSAQLKAKLAFGYFSRAAWVYASSNPEEDFQLALELGRQSLSGVQTTPHTRLLGHWLLAYVYSQRRNFGQALDEANATIELAPYDAYLLIALAEIAAMAGQPDKALAWATEGVHRDLRVSRPFIFGLAHYVKGDYQDALDALAKDDFLQVDYLDPFVLRASVLMRLDREEEARKELARALQMEPTYSLARVRDRYAYSDPSILERQIADLRKAGLPE